MPYETYQILLCALILLAGGFLQSTVGFAFGLFAIPLLMWIKIPIEQVLAIITVSTCAQSLVASRAMSEVKVPKQMLLIAASIRIVFIVLGTLILQLIVDFDKNIMHAIMGVILICSVLLLWLLPQRKTETVQRGLLYGVSAPLSGTIGGMIGMGGPPLLLWAMLQPWDPKQIRVFLFMMFMTSIPFQFPILVIVFGWDVCWGAALAVLCFPLVYVGSRLGVQVGNKLSKAQLTHIVYVLLLILGTRSIFKYF